MATEAFGWVGEEGWTKRGRRRGTDTGEKAWLGLRRGERKEVECCGGGRVSRVIVWMKAMVDELCGESGRRRWSWAGGKEQVIVGDSDAFL